MEGPHDRVGRSRSAVGPVQESRVFMFLFIVKVPVLSVTLESQELHKVNRKTCRENVMDMVDKGAMNVWFHKIVSYDQGEDGELVPLILFLKGQGQSFAIMRWDIADGDKVSEAPYGL